MRLFIAVNLTTEVKLAIQNAIDRFPIANPPWRWVRGEGLHVTLKFLGDTPEDEIPQIVAHVEAVCGKYDGFGIRLGRLGGFPNLTRPRVLFYQVEEGGESLAGISADINEALENGLGILKEPKKFRAHITIARIKRPIPKEAADLLEVAPALHDVSQTVSSVDLMSSELRREGARYQLVKEIALERTAW